MTARPRADAPPRTVGSVVQQHADDAIALRTQRTTVVRAAHAGLRQLERLDERLAAHLDGLLIAGDDGIRRVIRELGTAGVGEVFVVGVLAIEHRHEATLERLILLAGQDETLERGLVSAFGWVPRRALAGIAARLLGSGRTLDERLGLAACVMHGVDPGSLHAGLLARGATPTLHRDRLRAAARLGRVDLVHDCLAALRSDDSVTSLLAAQAAVLLGDRAEALSTMEELASTGRAGDDGPLWRLLPKALPPGRARRLLCDCLAGGLPQRTLVRAVGVAGDPHFAAWLIDQARDPGLARLAAQAFGLMAGLDVASVAAREAPRPHARAAEDETGDDPMEDGLPWPDVDALAAWWSTAAPRFVAGRRYFMGEEPSVALCRRILGESASTQSQRLHAAEHLALLAPDAPWFNVAAPAWRQRRRLERSS